MHVRSLPPGTCAFVIMERAHTHTHTRTHTHTHRGRERDAHTERHRVTQDGRARMNQVVFGSSGLYSHAAGLHPAPRFNPDRSQATPKACTSFPILWDLPLNSGRRARDKHRALCYERTGRSAGLAAPSTGPAAPLVSYSAGLVGSSLPCYINRQTISLDRV